MKQRAHLKIREATRLNESGILMIVRSTLPALQPIWARMCNTDLISFLKVLQNLLVKISVLGFYFMENFLFVFSVFYF